MYLCYINNEFVNPELNPEKAMLPISDLIIQRGVGVFEVIASHKSKALMLTPHLERFINSATSSGIINIPDINFMKDIIHEGILKVNKPVRIKAYITGGDHFDEATGKFTQPRFFVIFEAPDFVSQSERENGVTLEPVPFGRDDPNVKSVDYRKTYQLPAGAYEHLYCPDGEITEAGHSTFFLVLKNNTLVTAPLERVLKGTTRLAILELAKSEGLKIEERCPLWSELVDDNAAEAFITGSVKRVVPVVKIGGIVMGDGKPGKITKRLAALYDEYIERWLE